MMKEEKRTSFRCKGFAGSPKAVLQINKKEIVVDLDDQSAGGFAVSSNKRIPVREGSNLLIRTSAGWCEATVAYKEKHEGMMRVGLERICDLPDPRDRCVRGGRHAAISNAKSTPSGTILSMMLVLGLTFWIAVMGLAWLGDENARSFSSRVSSILTLVSDS